MRDISHTSKCVLQRRVTLIKSIVSLCTCTCELQELCVSAESLVLSSTYPRRELTVDMEDTTLVQLGLAPSGVVIVRLNRVRITYNPRPLSQTLRTCVHVQVQSQDCHFNPRPVTYNPRPVVYNPRPLSQTLCTCTGTIPGLSLQSQASHIQSQACRIQSQASHIQSLACHIQSQACHFNPRPLTYNPRPVTYNPRPPMPHSPTIPGPTRCPVNPPIVSIPSCLRCV